MHEQDLIVGETLSVIAFLRSLAWLDPVDSASNPIDGISRKNFNGIRQWRNIGFPGSLLSSLQECVSRRLSSHKTAFNL